MDASSRPDGTALKANTETAETSRGSLRRYAERLHEPNPTGLSLYTARAQYLAAHEDVPILEVPSAIVAASTPDQIDELRSLLRALPETADLAHPTRTHGWGFLDSADSLTAPTQQVHDAARSLDDSLTDALTTGADPALLAAVTTPDEVEAWSSVARAPRFPLDAVDAVHSRTLSGELPQLRQRLLGIKTDSPAWFETVAPTALDLDVRAIHAQAVAADESGFFGRRKRRRAVLLNYGGALKVDPKRFDPKAVRPLTGEIVRTADDIGSLSRLLETVPLQLVPPSWNPYVGESIDHIDAKIGWATWLGETLTTDHGNEALRTQLRDSYRLAAPDERVAQSLASLATAWRHFTEILGKASTAQAWAGQDGFFSTWQQTRNQRNVATASPVALDRWIAFVRQLEPLRRAGMLQARTDLLTGEIPADLASLAFDKGVAVASIVEREESQALTDFDVPAHNRTIERFTSSATSIRAELPRWIPAEIIASRKVDPSFDGGSMGELKRQLSRQRGGMSVRALFENYGGLITQISPCVLMSPESVARFFPARSKMFDIVVFDEASQIRVADAVGAMGRGSSVVVVGDSKQMPPTSFAEVSLDAESDAAPGAESVVDEESILTECVQARVPSKWLSWHYRSQDEALISFSNHAYYESRLSSFPAPWRGSTSMADDDHGLSLVRVAGYFNRSGRGRDLRTNAVEAQAIVDDVARRFASSPDTTPSLGIITFNAPQRALIENLLRENPDERIARALDERDGVFVKNLENVQGDERDVILFSVAFSANERGYVPLNFGPLSRAGGERRLNVAITRARRQVILFASFDPSELRAEETASVGIKHLKGYLELAGSGIESATDSAHREAIVDRHRDEIAAALRDRGFAVKTDVGLSDFRVDIAIASPADPAQPLVAVLLDGESWRGRRTVADRDGLPVDVLKGLMHWPGVERVWLPEWLQQRDETLARLERAVADAAEELNRRAEVVIPASVPLVSETEPEASSLVPIEVSFARTRAASTGLAGSAPRLQHPQLREFVRWELKRSGSVSTLDMLPSRTAAESVRSVIRDIVQREGPVHKMRLARLVAEAFGLSRVAAARSDSILRCIPTEYLAAHDKSCVWPTNIDPTTWRNVRRSQAGDGRNLDHVPLEEIANAMAVVAQLGGGMNDEDLRREALALFGGKRLTDGISSRLSQAMQRGLESGRIERDASGRWTAVEPG